MPPPSIDQRSYERGFADAAKAAQRLMQSVDTRDLDRPKATAVKSQLWSLHRAIEAGRLADFLP